MDRILFWLACASALLLLLAVGVAWWEHRKHMARVNQQRALAEDSRMALHDSGPQLAQNRKPAQPEASPQSKLDEHQRPHAGATPPQAPVPSGASTPMVKQETKPVTAPKARPSDAAARLSLIESALARGALGAPAPVPASVLASRAELAAMEQVPTWEDTQPMVLETTPLEFAPTQMEPHAFDFEPTRPVDLSHH